jgi:hypothetical protein
MKVEYLNDMTDGGKYKQVVSENLIRLYDFDTNQTTEFAKLVFQTLIVAKQKLDLSSVEFIEPVNCQLILQLSLVDKGILKTDKPNVFTCDLTEQSFTTAIEYMKATDSGYNWLCDTSDDNIDFLYSPGGTW